jgi:mercuric reductase
VFQRAPDYYLKRLQGTDGQADAPAPIRPGSDQGAVTAIARGDGDFDLVVIGSGGAAFAAAIKASELGATVAVLERGTVGGTCINVGCVPSKALIRAAESLHRAQQTPFAGISVRGELTDFSKLVAQKDELVAEMRQTKYIDNLRAMPNVTLFEGQAAFTGKNTLRVADKTIRAGRFVIATGAGPTIPNIPGLADSGFLTSTTVMELTEVPAELLVLGGRYIALELAQMFSRVGSRVTIIQRSSHILPTEDDDLTDELAMYLRDEGLTIVTNAQTETVRRNGRGYLLDVNVGGDQHTFEGTHLLAATGRRPNTEDLELERIGASVQPDATLVVNDYLETTESGVYGAGDVIGNPAFVYTAAYEGALAAENALSGTPRSRDYTALPWVVFTDPQVAAVGLNERSAAAAEIAVDVAKLPLSYVSRALTARNARGFIKLIKERGTDRLLGASILAPEAGDIIMEPALAIRHGIGVSELVAAFHPYLTQAEGIRLAAQTFEKDVAKLSCCA